MFAGKARSLPNSLEHLKGYRIGPQVSILQIFQNKLWLGHWQIFRLVYYIVYYIEGGTIE